MARFSEGFAIFGGEIPSTPSSTNCEVENPNNRFCESFIRDSALVLTPAGLAETYFSTGTDLFAGWDNRAKLLSTAASNKVRYVDINGDGLSDRIERIYTLLTDNGGSNELYFRLNNGAGYGTAVSIGIIPEDSYRFFDYNFDGYSDLYWHDVSAKQIKVAVWNPSSTTFNTPIDIRATSGSATAAHIIVDINSDSIPDYFVFKDDLLTSYLGQAAGASQNRITKISNGLGADTNITYSTLGDDESYGRLSFGNGSSSPIFCYDNSCTPYHYSPTNKNGFYSALNSDWSGSDTLGKTGPIMELIGPMPVVTKVSSSAPTAANANAESSISYYYGEAKIQASGRGFLGFERLKTVDDQTGVQTITTYRQDWPFIGYPQKTQVYSAQGSLLSESENTWRLKNFSSSWSATVKSSGSSALGSVQPYLANSVEKTYALAGNGANQGALLQSIQTDNLYDNYGNPTSIDVTTKDGANNAVANKNTVNVYGASEWEQRMGRLSRTTVTTVRGTASDIRTSAFNYYESGTHKGLLKEEIVEPDDTALRLSTLYEYDSVGNKIRATQSTAGETSRVSESVYDADGRYLLETRNGFGQVTQTIVSRNILGQVTEARNIDNVRALSYYSPMGRQYFSADETGAWSQTLLQTCDAHCPATGTYQSSSEQAGGARSKTYYDKLGREVRTAALLFDGSWSFVDTEYDALGRVSRKSEPHTGTPQYWTQFSYDILGRVVQSTLPGVSQPVTVTYNGLTTITTNPKGQTKTETKNVLGELIEVIDNLQGRLTYGYDVQGNLLTATSQGSLSDPHSVVVSMSYDRLGRKTAMNDPDKGAWSYRYNGFGELVEQTDAKGQITTMSYDRLGRMATRIDRRADSSIEADTRWTYNNATLGQGLGALSQVEDVVSGYLKAVNYDSFGRSSEVGTSLAANDDHYQKVVYDQFGRTFQVFDAAGDGEWNSHASQQHYNAYGFLEKVTDAVHVNGSPQTIYYQVLAMDHRGNVTEAANGNNVTTVKHFDPATGRLLTQNSSVLAVLGGIQELSYSWDDLGNLLHRHDYSGDKNLEESFQYDGLNRLTSSQIVGGSAQTLSYDSLGNITHKSDVGTYTYGGSQGDGGHGPHAVTSTSDGVSYNYDANGNLTSDSLSTDGKHGGRTLKYTTFDKPFEITKGSHTTSFKYDPARSRFMRTDTNAGGTTVTRYLGSVEKITKPNGTQEVKRYIGDALITISLDASDAVTGEKLTYLHKDHLGSVDIITDALGNVVQELSFDAWGQRRDAVDWNALDVASLLSFDHSETTRGFTGHEMLDEVGLIHMNGRIYDARLGRFLQADPFIQAAANTQSYNRYSYTWNNPLNATDPSGFILSHLAAKKHIQSSWVGKNIIQPVLQTVSRNPVLNAIATIVIAYYGGPAAVAAYSEAAAYANGGSLADGIKAGAISYAQSMVFSGIGDSGLGTPARIFAHGVAGGVFSVLQGGKFGHGFVSAGVTKAVNVNSIFTADNQALLRVSTAAIIGGTVSKLTGGKFANGAITAAFAQMYNGESTRDAHEGQASWEEKYNKLWERFQKTAADNPDGPLDMSKGDLNTIVQYMKEVTQGKEKYSFMSDEYKGQFGSADTFLYLDKSLVGRQFRYNGKLHYGGDMNYIGVGMLSAHYGFPHSLAMPAMVVKWNYDQYRAGEGPHNLRQMGTGTLWAEYGAHMFRQ